MPHEAIERANRELARLRYEIELFKGSMKRAEEAVDRAEELVCKMLKHFDVKERPIYADIYNPPRKPDSTHAKPTSAIRRDLEQAPDFI